MTEIKYEETEKKYRQCYMCVCVKCADLWTNAHENKSTSKTRLLTVIPYVCAHTLISLARTPMNSTNLTFSHLHLFVHMLSLSLSGFCAALTCNTLTYMLNIHARNIKRFGIQFNTNF